MSTRLDLALHDVADAAGLASTFGDADDDTTVATLQRLAGRVRRRRATRSAGTVAVAASAAGVVAVVGPHLTAELSPAADPDADPGTCRSSVAALPSGALLGVDLGHVAADGSAEADGPGSARGLGTWQTREADVLVSVSRLPETVSESARLRLLVTRKEVVVATSQRQVDTLPTSTAAVLAELRGTPPTPGPTDDAPVHALAGAAPWLETGHFLDEPDTVAQLTPLSLTACDGSGALLPGDYDVWATTLDEEGRAHGSAGPWELTVAPGSPRITGLPDGFPRAVPLVAGTLVTAHRHGDGWAAEVVTPGEDRAVAAARLLHDALPQDDGSPVGLSSPTVARDRALAAAWEGIELPGWRVRVVPSHTPDGEPSLVYVLAPTD